MNRVDKRVISSLRALKDFCSCVDSDTFAEKRDRERVDAGLDGSAAASQERVVERDRAHAV